MKKRIGIAISAIIAVFLVVWVGSLIRCEILTKTHYSDFCTAHEDNAWICDAAYFKVLRCDGNTAEVYYVSNDLGAVLEFCKKDSIWEETGWRAVWATHGSASETVWPYWWHGNNALTP